MFWLGGRSSPGCPSFYLPAQEIFLSMSTPLDPMGRPCALAATRAPTGSSSHSDFLARHRGWEASSLFESSHRCSGSSQQTGFVAPRLFCSRNLICLGLDDGARPVTLRISRLRFFLLHHGESALCI